MTKAEDHDKRITVLEPDTSANSKEIASLKERCAKGMKVADKSIDVLVISETWFTPLSQSSLFAISGYNLVRNDRGLLSLRNRNTITAKVRKSRLFVTNVVHIYTMRLEQEHNECDNRGTKKDYFSHRRDLTADLSHTEL
ncbi:hypothetical protein TSAR_000612 [Trichomalopsis sarcophagae]|uniref:Uncharacterized protein n=1 Tax=Trichomalopsis sarcophagae TaxID=543379 RepID=A0A232FAF7_9HYME|nr:hypothetical protein TSAR_000612 [Trichomalopsis sarcophagae]